MALGESDAINDYKSASVTEGDRAIYNCKLDRERPQDTGSRIPKSETPPSNSYMDWFRPNTFPREPALAPTAMIMTNDDHLCTDAVSAAADDRTSRVATISPCHTI